MNINMFLMLLFAFSVISSLFTEGTKKLLDDKSNFSYNLIALIISLIVGTVGSGIYYQLNDIPFNVNNIIYMVLLGLFSGLCSMLGYDKVKQTIIQLTNNKIDE